MSIAEIEATEIGLEAPPSGLWSEAWRRLRHNHGAVVGFVMVGTFVFVALFAPLIAPYDPLHQDLSLLNGGCCPGRPPSISSESTRSAATSSRGSCTALAIRY